MASTALLSYVGSSLLLLPCFYFPRIVGPVIALNIGTLVVPSVIGASVTPEMTKEELAVEKKLQTTQNEIAFLRKIQEEDPK